MAVLVHVHGLAVDLDGVAGIRVTGHDQVGVAHGYACRRQLQDEFGNRLYSEYRYAIVVGLDQDLHIGVAHKSLRVSGAQHEYVSSGLQLQLRLESPACIYLERYSVEFDVITDIRPGEQAIGIFGIGRHEAGFTTPRLPLCKRPVFHAARLDDVQQR